LEDIEKNKDSIENNEEEKLEEVNNSFSTENPNNEDENMMMQGYLSDENNTNVKNVVRRNT
jgi:hypothetical protein